MIDMSVFLSLSLFLQGDKFQAGNKISGAGVAATYGGHEGVICKVIPVGKDKGLMRWSV